MQQRIDKTSIDALPTNDKAAPQFDLNQLNEFFKSPENAKKLVGEFKLSLIVVVLFIIFSLIKTNLFIKCFALFIVFYIIYSWIRDK
jgi:hypothetical protein